MGLCQRNTGCEQLPAHRGSGWTRAAASVTIGESSDPACCRHPTEIARQRVTRIPAVPRLLVSVRDAREAQAAVRGGAQIIDVKEPNRGPLGRADAAVVASIVEAVRLERVPSAMRLSVALGELHEMALPLNYVIPPGVSYAKLGLAGMGQNPSWATNAWNPVRTAYEQNHRKSLEWVGVIYADGAGGPPAREIINAAHQADCVGVLIDTFDKQSGGLFSQVSIGELTELADRCRELDMFFAVAGRLSQNDLASLVDVQPDIVAIRSAACDAQDRCRQVSSTAVQRFRDVLTQTFAPSSRRTISATK